MIVMEGTQQCYYNLHSTGCHKEWNFLSQLDLTMWGHFPHAVRDEGITKKLTDAAYENTDLRVNVPKAWTSSDRTGTNFMWPRSAYCSLFAEAKNILP
jgi:hypothetical protein